MKLTAAQKQKRYRENLKRKGRHNVMKAKHRERMKDIRSKLSDFQREQYVDMMQRLVKMLALLTNNSQSMLPLPVPLM
jgi:glycyl-tRNA synthetase alpha subunit